MVFTANGGTVRGNTFVSGNFRFKERKGEEEHFQKWFQDNGYEVKTLEQYQGGEGDALFYKNTLYMGWGFRSDPVVTSILVSIVLSLILGFFFRK